MENTPRVRPVTVEQRWFYDGSGFVIDEYSFTVCDCRGDFDLAKHIVNAHNTMLENANES